MIRLDVKLRGGFALVYTKRELRRALRYGGNLVAVTARKLVRHTGSGRLYGRHRASAPGEAPAAETGKLARSIKVRPWRRLEGVSISSDVRSAGGSGAPYAKFLELGARGGVGSGRKGVKGKRNKKRLGQIIPVGQRVLLPRPFLTTALDINARAVGERIRASLDKDFTIR